MKINHIQKLYRVEKIIRDRTAEEKVIIRKEQPQSLLKQYKIWLDKSSLQVPPKSAVGNTIVYNLNQWQNLIHYVDNGHLNIDNNRAERAVKPFMIDRENLIFCNTASQCCALQHHRSRKV